MIVNWINKPGFVPSLGIDVEPGQVIDVPDDLAVTLIDNLMAEEDSQIPEADPIIEDEIL